MRQVRRVYLGELHGLNLDERVRRGNKYLTALEGMAVIDDENNRSDSTGDEQTAIVLYFESESGVLAVAAASKAKMATSPAKMKEAVATTDTAVATMAAEGVGEVPSAVAKMKAAGKTKMASSVAVVGSATSGTTKKGRAAKRASEAAAAPGSARAQARSHKQAVAARTTRRATSGLQTLASGLLMKQMRRLLRVCAGGLMRACCVCVCMLHVCVAVTALIGAVTAHFLAKLNMFYRIACCHLSMLFIPAWKTSSMEIDHTRA